MPWHDVILVIIEASTVRQQHSTKLPPCRARPQHHGLDDAKLHSSQGSCDWSGCTLDRKYEGCSGSDILQCKEEISTVL